MNSPSIKRVLVTALLLAFLATASGGFAASSLDEEGSASDVIVLLDISQSVLPYFHDITDYVVSSVVKDFLRIGDTFHLISFGESSQVEIAQRVSGEQDVRSILARLYLLYPIARNTDLVSSLGYLYQYLADLPESRSKVVVLITDGVSNPPPSSPEYGKDQETASKDMDAAATRIRSNGWPVYIIKVPFSPERAAAEAKGNPKGGAAPTAEGADKALDTLAAALNTTVTDYTAEEKGDIARKSLSLPVAEFPGDLGKRGYSFAFPLKIHNQGDSEISLELTRVRSGDADILQKKAFLSVPSKHSGTMDIKIQLSPETPSGPTKLPVDLYFADGTRVSPSHGFLSFTLAPSPLASLFRSGSRVILFVILVAVGFVLVGVAVGFITKRGPRKASIPVVAAVREAEEERREAREAKAKAAGTSSSAGPVPVPGVPGAKPSVPGALPGVPAKASPEAAKQGAPKVAETAAEAKLPGKLAQAPAGVQAPGQPVAATVPGLGVPEAASATPAKETKAERKAREKASLVQEKAQAATAERRAAQATSGRIVKPGTIQLELRVQDQNPYIGLRNVQVLHAGQGKTVGGGRSDFLVFLVSVPRRVAEIYYDGDTCTFLPLRPEHFPGIGPEGIKDCLGKDIPMVSKQGYPMVLHFSKYVAPVDKVNRLLHCIETPGLFDEEA